jgi:hypothetical protein
VSFVAVPQERNGSENLATKYPAKWAALKGPEMLSCRSGLRPETSRVEGDIDISPTLMAILDTLLLTIELRVA